MKYLLVLSFILVCSGCLADNIIRKPSGELHQNQNKLIYKELSKQIQTGDWLVIRGYHKTDNLVAGATGIPLSHVGVFDADSMMVIEAEGIGVHATPLPKFIDKSDRVILIRPRWLSGKKEKRQSKKLIPWLGKITIF